MMRTYCFNSLTIGMSSIQQSSQLTYHYLDGWGEILHNPAAAEAILDRLVYKSHIIKIAGNSYRLKSATNHKAPS